MKGRFSDPPSNNMITEAWVIDCRNLLLTSLVLTLSLNVAAAMCQAAQAMAEQDTNDNRDASDWYLTRMGNGRTKSGYPFSVNTYNGSKGGIVLASITHCGTAESANKEYQSRIDAATKVIETGKVKDKNGDTKGGRAVISVTIGNQKASVRIVSVAGSNVLQIASSSLPEVLSFERDGRRVENLPRGTGSH
jgi:hypothetical protein